MNVYGEQARRHWQEGLPEQYEAIDNPPTPVTWDVIFEASVIDVEVVVLPRRTTT